MKKIKISKHFLLLLFVSLGLLYITRSFWMSLGIMMLLLLIDALLAQYERKHRHDHNDSEPKE